MLSQGELYIASMKAAMEVYERVKQSCGITDPFDEEIQAIDIEIDKAWLPILKHLFEKDGFDCFQVDDTSEEDWIIAICVRPKIQTSRSKFKE